MQPVSAMAELVGPRDARVHLRDELGADLGAELQRIDLGLLRAG
jgi:hypothetical protein